MSKNIDTHLPQWLGAIQALAAYEKLFITGCPRSGTTWLLNLLNGHPRIAGGGEGRFAWRLFPFLQQAVWAFNGDQQTNHGSPQGLIHDAELHLVMRSFSENVFLRYLKESGKSAGQVSVLADKTPQHVLSVELLRALYPSCRFINIVRDPRDAAVSAWFHLARAGATTAREYMETFIRQSWKAHVEAAVTAEERFGGEVFLNIRYEDLHAREREVLRRCLAHVKVDESDEMVRLCSEAGGFQKLSAGRQRGQKDTGSFYRNGTVGDWPSHLEVQLAMQICQPVEQLMRRFGYSLIPPAAIPKAAA